MFFARLKRRRSKSRSARADAANAPEMRPLAGDAKQAEPPFLTRRFLTQRARAVRLIVQPVVPKRASRRMSVAKRATFARRCSSVNPNVALNAASARLFARSACSSSVFACFCSFASRARDDDVLWIVTWLLRGRHDAISRRSSRRLHRLDCADHFECAQRGTNMPGFNACKTCERL